MSAANGDMRAWLKERGHDVNMRGRVRADLAEIYYAEHPAERPAGSVALLPGPDDDWDSAGDGYDDIGLLEPGAELPPHGPESDGDGRTGPRTYVAEPAGEPKAPRADGEPAHSGKDWRKEARAREAPKAGGRGAPRKVSVTVRGDISAKISFALMVPGQIWKARDPLCGGTFVEQVPEMSDAFTDIVCDSPDLIAFFAGPGGNFMKILKVGAAVMPVLQVAMAHHVYHTIDQQEDMQQPDYGSYAA